MKDFENMKIKQVSNDEICLRKGRKHSLQKPKTIQIQGFNSLPNDNFLDLSILKAFADNNVNILKNKNSFFWDG